MAIYIYKGQGVNSGKRTKGSIEADTLKDARAKLRRQNIYVFELKEDSKVDSARGGGSFFDKLNRKPPKTMDVALATKQFSIMVNAGVDINDSLRAVTDQIENAELKSVYISIRDLIAEGKSLSEAHKRFPKVFDPIYSNMIAAGERSGSLGLVLKRLSDFMFYQIEIKRKLIGALTYPAIMVVAAIGITLYLFVKVVPQMMDSFKLLSNVTLPWYTVLLNDLSVWLQNWWFFLFMVLIIFSVVTYLWSKTPSGKLIFHRIILKIYILGPLIQKINISRFSKTLSTILSSGVRVVEALNLTKMIIGNVIIKNAVEDAISRVQDGEKLASALEKTQQFPMTVIHMMRTGEKTGKMEDMLVNIGEVYDDDVEDQISSTTRLIEPIMLIFMGFIVTFVVVSIIKPMMDIMNSLN